MLLRPHTTNLSQNHHHQFHSDYSSDDVDVREQAPDTYEPKNFEEVPSPPRLDLELNSDDDDLIIDESNTSPTEPENVPLRLPEEPLRPPPKPPTRLNIGTNDLESLAETAPFSC
jgi:hypothetical protein